MLTEKEKDVLYKLITVYIGEDATIKARKSAFSVSTVRIVEAMINANIHCNSSMKHLFSSLAKGGSGIAKGWLKKSLAAMSKTIGSTTFNGYGCAVASKARWKSAILISAI